MVFVPRMGGFEPALCLLVKSGGRWVLQSHTNVGNGALDVVTGARSGAGLLLGPLGSGVKPGGRTTKAVITSPPRRDGSPPRRCATPRSAPAAASDRRTGRSCRCGR